MAYTERKILEDIAIDIALNDMENIGESTEEILRQAENLTDAELLDFLCRW